MQNLTEIVVFPINELVKEPGGDGANIRYSHPRYLLKKPTVISLCEYDQKKQLVEVEHQNGKRAWIPLRRFFGPRIADMETIAAVYLDGHTEQLIIIGIDIVKVKRTNYMKLIFETDLPF